MRQLALIRHGDITGPDLSPLGERQATMLGRRLRDLIPAGTAAGPGQRVRVISSPAPRARQTASIISSFLQVLEPEENWPLWSGSDGDPDNWEHDLAGLLAQCEAWGENCDLLVVVTHFEICAGLPGLLTRRFALDGHPPSQLRRGEGLVLSPATGVWEHLKG